MYVCVCYKEGFQSAVRAGRRKVKKMLIPDIYLLIDSRRILMHLFPRDIFTKISLMGFEWYMGKQLPSIYPVLDP